MEPELDAEEKHRRRAERVMAMKDLLIDSNTRATKVGVEALKAVTLVNGAGSIALLAYIGQVASTDRTANEHVIRLLGPLKLLVAGVLVAALALGFGYMRSFFESIYFAEEIDSPGKGKRWVKFANIALFTAIALTLISYLLFGAGVYVGAQAIANSLK